MKANNSSLTLLIISSRGNCRVFKLIFILNRMDDRVMQMLERLRQSEGSLPSDSIQFAAVSLLLEYEI